VNDYFVEILSKFFSNLLNKKNANASPSNHPVPESTDLDIQTSTITRSKVVLAISRLKGSKAPGPDYAMTAEVLKNGGEFIIDQLLKIFKMVYENCHAPTQWTSSLIIPLPKKRKSRTNDKLPRY
jgi:hypothetical protein